MTSNCGCRAKTAEGATIVVRFGEGIAGTVAQRGTGAAASNLLCISLCRPSSRHRCTSATSATAVCSCAHIEAAVSAGWSGLREQPRSQRSSANQRAKPGMRHKYEDNCSSTALFTASVSMVAAGGVMNIEDAYCDPLFSPEVDVRLGYRTNSILCCSIADMSGKNIAVLQVRL